MAHKYTKVPKKQQQQLRELIEANPRGAKGVADALGVNNKSVARWSGGYGQSCARIKKVSTLAEIAKLHDKLVGQAQAAQAAQAAKPKPAKPKPKAVAPLNGNGTTLLDTLRSRLQPQQDEQLLREVQATKRAVHYLLAQLGVPADVLEQLEGGAL